VDTDLWKWMSEENKAKFFEAHEAKVATGKVGQAEDVAECYLWLMKDKNVTGTVVQSDGGVLLV